MKIETNIPIPEQQGLMASTLKHMQIGNSVVIPTTKVSSWRTQAWQLKMKVCARKISETESRLWRIA